MARLRLGSGQKNRRLEDLLLPVQSSASIQRAEHRQSDDRIASAAHMEDIRMKQPNRIKAAMRGGRKAYGYNLSFPSPWVIDLLGKLDFDFVFIDGEHGPFGLDQLEDLCRTAE